jgi:hypothetical protein
LIDRSSRIRLRSRSLFDRVLCYDERQHPTRNLCSDRNDSTCPRSHSRCSQEPQNRSYDSIGRQA